MALKLRRGTDSERTNIVFEEGEPVYVTDTGELYIGDGTTSGGNRVSNEVELDTTPRLGGNLDLNQFNIEGTGNINIDGNIIATGNIELGNGVEDNITVGGQISSSLIPDAGGEYDLGAAQSVWRIGFFEGLDIDGEISANSIAVNDIYSPDSSVIYETATNTLFGNLNGSVFADDGDTIVNSLTSDVFANILSSQKVDDPGILQLTRETADDISGQPALRYGTIEFARIDANGRLNTGAIIGYESAIIIVSDTSGNFDDTSQYVTITNAGEVGIGTVTPTSKLDVRGSAVIEGELTVSALKGSVVSDDSTIIIDSVDNTITSGGYIQFGSYTDTSRPSGANGMVIYNSTSDRFQGYQNGSWINLDDGSPA